MSDMDIVLKLRTHLSGKPGPESVELWFGASNTNLARCGQTLLSKPEQVLARLVAPALSEVDRRRRNGRRESDGDSSFGSTNALAVETPAMPSCSRPAESHGSSASTTFGSEHWPIHTVADVRPRVAPYRHS